MPTTNSLRPPPPLQKKQIVINIYDLLPPGRFSTLMWTIGVSLLHSGVVVGDREYAFGGHDRPGMTGVYWTKPRTEPPGGTFRAEVLQGFTNASDGDIDEIIRDASKEFLGQTYNLLTRNCNHFTSHLCYVLTGHHAPRFLNRAASIGVALPCVVPAGWVEPPGCDAGGGNDQGESARLTRNAGAGGGSPAVLRAAGGGDDAWESSEGEYTSEDSEDERERRRRRGVKIKMRDTGGRELPTSERARLGRTV